MKLSIAALLLAAPAALAQTEIRTSDRGATLSASTLTIHQSESVDLSLAIKPQFNTGPVIQALCGTYQHNPKLNDWNRGEITFEGGNVYRWTNEAGVSWALYLDPTAGYFETGTDNPYYWSYPDTRSFSIRWGSYGEVLGFDFFGFYARQGSANDRIGVAALGLVAEVWKSDYSQLVYAAPGGSYINYSTSTYTESWSPRTQSGAPLDPGDYHVRLFHYHDLGNGAMRYEAWLTLRIKSTWKLINEYEYFGIGEAQACLTLYAATNSSQESSIARTATILTIGFLGLQMEAFDARADTELTHGASKPELLKSSLRIGGYEVLPFDSRYYTGTTEIKVSSAHTGISGSVKLNAHGNEPSMSIHAGWSKSFAKAEKRIIVLGFIPIKVTGDVGIYGGVASEGKVNISQGSVTIDSGVNAKLYGTATAGLDAFVGYVYIYGTINLFESKIHTPISVQRNGKVTGQKPTDAPAIVVTFYPVSLEFGIGGSVGAYGTTYSITHELARWADWWSVENYPLIDL